MVYVEKRPWGKFEIILSEKNFQVKKITVNINQRLSYQYHEHRSETWTVVKGKAEVTVNKKKFNLMKGDIIKIEKLSHHRIKNISQDELVFIEVQLGEYLGEECKEMGIPSSAEDWNSTNCTGTLEQVLGGGLIGGYSWQYGPSCDTVLSTITTSSGEALIVNEMRGLTISSNCDGYNFTASSAHSFNGEWIISGSALNCTHNLIYSQYYTPSNTNTVVQQLVSIVYAIQDTTVV